MLLKALSSPSIPLLTFSGAVMRGSFRIFEEQQGETCEQPANRGDAQSAGCEDTLRLAVEQHLVVSRQRPGLGGDDVLHLVADLAQLVHGSQHVIVETACLRQDIGRALCLLERGVELGRGSSHPVGAIVELAQQLGVSGGVDVGAGCLLVDDGARHLVGVGTHGRRDLALGHVAHRAALDVEELGVLLELDLVAALHLDRGHDVELLEQVEVLLVDHGRGGIHRGLEVEQPAALRLVEPLVGVAVAVEDDALMCGERGAHPGKRGLLEVLRAVDCLREVLEGLRDGGVEACGTRTCCR